MSVPRPQHTPPGTPCQALSAQVPQDLVDHRRLLDQRDHPHRVAFYHDVLGFEVREFGLYTVDGHRMMIGSEL